jgi:hypothetical protein
VKELATGLQADQGCWLHWGGGVRRSPPVRGQRRRVDKAARLWAAAARRGWRWQRGRFDQDLVWRERAHGERGAGVTHSRFFGGTEIFGKKTHQI